MPIHHIESANQKLRIIIAPAKQMIEDSDTMSAMSTPVFLNRTKEVMTYMQSLSYAEAKKLWGCNDKLAEQNYERFAHMDLARGLTPAILAYDGIAYKYMAPDVLTDEGFAYIQEHLRILSGFYGILKPMDSVTPYRLEMQAKAKIAGSKNLYDYWGDSIYQELTSSECNNTKANVIINLASKEYSKCIEKYLTPEDTFITCIFGEIEKGKVVQKGVYAKMSRGEMVRYMAEHQIEKPEEIKNYDMLGYRFDEGLSDATNYVFLHG